MASCSSSMMCFFNDTATTEIFTLSLHDALPICTPSGSWHIPGNPRGAPMTTTDLSGILVALVTPRSEEHTSELQSRQYLVCRLLLDKKTRQWVVTRKSCVYSNHHFRLKR